MPQVNSFSTNFQNPVGGLDEYDAFVPRETEDWRKNVDNANTWADCVRLNDDVVYILDDRTIFDDP